MKRKILKSLNYADDSYVREADPRRFHKKSLWVTLSALAACFVLLFTGLGLWLFIPYDTTPPDVSRYSDSEYYEVIQKLNLVTYEKPKHKNNFMMLADELGNLFLASNKFFDGATGEAPMPEQGANSGDGVTNYEEVTDNQVEGVIEGDLFKRSGAYLYYLNLNENALYAYAIAGEDSCLTGSFFLSDIPMPQSLTGNDFREIYLSRDCKTVTLVGRGFYHNKAGDGNCTVLVSLDVSDPAAIKVANTSLVDGYLLSTRMVDGKLLVMTQKYYNKDTVRFDDESTYIPEVYADGEFSCLSADCIITPEVPSSLSYTVLAQYDEATLKSEGCMALLSYSDDFYITKDRVYATSRFDLTKEQVGTDKRVTMSEITAVSYGETFTLDGTVTVAGYVNDQYSFDEYEGILRVVTTTSDTSVSGVTNASLYCIDLATWQVAASVEKFAPAGETVQSVRFDKEYAYVCTAVVVTMTDPVFFFDLSDLENITCSDTGVIEGYSTSLVNFGNGYLLGIGYGASRSQMKVDIYREGEDKVESVTSYEAYVGFSENYKTYYIDRANQLVGIPCIRFDGVSQNRIYYLLFSFDGEALHLVMEQPIQGDMFLTRGVLIDEYFYICSDDAFYVMQPSENGVYEPIVVFEP